MKIKGIIFDVGQTLSNQLDKSHIIDRNKKYYAYVFQELQSRGFSQYFPNLPQYTLDRFVDDLNTLNLCSRSTKDTSTSILTEYTLPEQTLDLLISHENTFSTPIDRSSLAAALSELSSIYSGTLALEENAYELWPDTRETLVELKRRGYLLGIASNTAHPVKHEHMLARFGITPLIDHFAVSSYIGFRKPSTEMLRVLLEKMELTAQEVVVVGDLLDRDIMMGNLGGARTVWINAIPYSLERNLRRITEGDMIYRPTEGIVCLAQLIPTIGYLDNVVPGVEQVRVGYYFTNIREKLETGRKGAFVSNERVRYMPIELRAPIENQGEFDVIVHEVTDLMMSDKVEDVESMETLQKYIETHPSTLLLDPLAGLVYTMDRRAFLKIWGAQVLDGVNVRCPQLLEINSGRFPCIIKANMSYQGKESNGMVVVTSNDALQQALHQFLLPYVIEEWVNYGVLIKVYVLGEAYSYSLQMSSKVKKDITRFSSGKMPGQLESEVGIKVSEEVIRKINERVRNITGLGMVSYDMAVEMESGDYVIIDLKYFQGCYKMPNYKTAMDNYIISSFQKFKNNV